MLSLDEFRATRQFSPTCPIHLETYPNDAGYDQPVLLYKGDLVIGLVTTNWPGKAQLEGKYHLAISNQERISDDLSVLELQLYTDMYLPEVIGVSRFVPLEAIDEVVEALSHLWAAAKGLNDAYDRFPVLNDVQPDGADSVASVSFDEWLLDITAWQEAWKLKFAHK